MYGMYKKIINFPGKELTPIRPEEAIKTVEITVENDDFWSKKENIAKAYNNAVEWHLLKRYDDADEIFQSHGPCRAQFPLDFAWNLSLIKNKVDGFYANVLVNPDYPGIDCFLSNGREDFLLEYSGAKYDNSFGLWSVRRNNTLRHFLWELPVLRPIPAADTPFYKIPAVRNFYAGIVSNDLDRHKQNKFALLQFYTRKIKFYANKEKERKGAEYLFNFLAEHYPPML
jgi:hypothetical protein